MTTTPQAALLSDAYAQGIEAAASLLTRMADEHALEHGHDDMGALSFGSGPRAEAKMEWHSSLIELAEEIRRLDGAKLQATQQSADTRFINLELDIRRVLNWEKPLCDFDVVRELQEFVDAQAQAEPVQAGELPVPPTLSDDERNWLSHNPNTSDIEQWLYGYAVAYARAAVERRSDRQWHTRGREEGWRL